VLDVYSRAKHGQWIIDVSGTGSHMNEKLTLDEWRNRALFAEDAAQRLCGQFQRVRNRTIKDWIIEPSFLKKVKTAVDSVPEHYDLDMEQIEEVLLALEKVNEMMPAQHEQPANRICTCFYMGPKGDVRPGHDLDCPARAAVTEGAAP
jgi:hypothetical protein